MVERSLSMREVGGSIPPFSIRLSLLLLRFTIGQSCVSKCLRKHIRSVEMTNHCLKLARVANLVHRILPVGVGKGTLPHRKSFRL